MSTNIIILASGGDRKGWSADLPKQLADIHGQPLILRTLAQLKKRGLEAVVMTDKPAVQEAVPDFKVPAASAFGVESLLSSRPYWGERTILLGSDVVFTEAALDAILADQDALSVFGNTGELFAVAFSEDMADRVVQALEAAIAYAHTGKRGTWWTFYQALYGRKNLGARQIDSQTYKWIRDSTEDIDSVAKYTERTGRQVIMAKTPPEKEGIVLRFVGRPTYEGKPGWPARDLTQAELDHWNLNKAQLLAYRPKLYEEVPAEVVPELASPEEVAPEPEPEPVKEEKSATKTKTTKSRRRSRRADPPIQSGKSPDVDQDHDVIGGEPGPSLHPGGDQPGED